MGEPDIDQMSNVLNKGIFPQEIEDNLNGGTKVVKIQLEKGDTVDLVGVELEYKDGYYEVTEKGEKVLQNDINKGRALPVGSERNWKGTTYVKHNDGSWKPKKKEGKETNKDSDKKLEVNKDKINEWKNNLGLSESQKNNNNYGQLDVEDWHLDDFKEYIKDESNAGGFINNKQFREVIGLPPSISFSEYVKENNGTGLNNNKYYKEFDGSINGAMYDVGEAIKNKLKG